MPGNRYVYMPNIYYSFKPKKIRHNIQLQSYSFAPIWLKNPTFSQFYYYMEKCIKMNENMEGEAQELSHTQTDPNL